MVAGQCGGFYSSHMRDESAGLLDAIDEAIEIGEKGEVKVEIFHIKGAYAPGWGKLMPEGLAKIEAARARGVDQRSEEHTSELQSLMRISYAVFCLKKKNT